MSRDRVVLLEIFHFLCRENFGGVWHILSFMKACTMPLQLDRIRGRLEHNGNEEIINLATSGPAKSSSVSWIVSSSDRSWVQPCLTSQLATIQNYSANGLQEIINQATSGTAKSSSVSLIISSSDRSWDH